MDIKIGLVENGYLFNFILTEYLKVKFYTELLWQWLLMFINGNMHTYMD